MLPFVDFVGGAESGLEGSGEGVASGGEADEGELVVAVAEDGVL
jgi:hypothetical protein